MRGYRRLERIRRRHHIVVAYLALFVALGGSAVAAKPLIDGADVQDESLTTADIQNESLTGDDILETSLGRVGDADTLDGKDSADFLATTGKAADADTLDGRDSADFLATTGKAADADTLDGKDATAFLESTVVRRTSVELPAQGRASAVARCLPGERATGGGVNAGGHLDMVSATVSKSYPTTGEFAHASSGATPTAWGGWISNPTNVSGTLYVFVICAA